MKKELDKASKVAKNGKIVNLEELLQSVEGLEVENMSLHDKCVALEATNNYSNEELELKQQLLINLQTTLEKKRRECRELKYHKQEQFNLIYKLKTQATELQSKFSINSDKVASLTIDRDKLSSKNKRLRDLLSHHDDITTTPRPQLGALLEALDLPYYYNRPTQYKVDQILRVIMNFRGSSPISQIRRRSSTVKRSLRRMATRLDYNL